MLGQCRCGTYYTESEEASDVISSCLEEGKPTMYVGVCPYCGQKVVHGGEPDYDPEIGDCILCFSGEYDKQKDSDLQEFVNVRLIKCKEDEHEFSTVEGSTFSERGEQIFLKREE